MILMRFAAILSIISTICYPLVSGYSSGPPNGLCTSMQPSTGAHGTATSNTGSPFRVNVSKSTYDPGETLTVTIESTTADKFVGFMLQARKVGDTKPQGAFTGTLPAKAQHYDCTGQGADSKAVVVHQNPSSAQVKWPTLSFAWTAPNPAVGDIKFRATVVKEKIVYYLGLESSNVVNNGSVVPSPTMVLPSATASQPTNSPGSLEFSSSACEKTKGCVLEPTSCSSSSTCSYLLTFSADGDKVTFEISGKASGWAAVGFNEDNTMAGGDVLACVQRGGSVVLEHYINNGKTPVKSAKAEGASLLASSYTNGIVKCRFTRLKETADAKTRDLKSPWFLIAAYGDKDGSDIAYHKEWRFLSSEKVDFSKVFVVGGERPALLQAHACLMIIAWLGCAGVGIIFARFLRNVWGDFLGLKLWFQVHRAAMASAVLLSIAGLVCVFTHVQAWSQGVHPILGIIVVSLATLQPIIAFFRPHPGEEKRVIFNWVHRSIAVVAFLLALASIFTGFQQPALNPGDEAVYAFIVFLVVFVLLCIGLEIFSCVKNPKAGAADIITDADLHSNKMTMEQTVTLDNDHNVKKGALVVFVLVMVAVVITLIVLVAKKD